ncbi:MAG: SIS domain-containing protein [Candidatus Thalassarchaeaceae archaeon]|jgi:glucose/mannose-6-phosphate isomerase|nr:SIS domain-containing protein [Candidatus Thalassarchaeaceae archaeon]
MADMKSLAMALDNSGMLGYLRNFPTDLAGAWDRAPTWDLSSIQDKQYSGVICLGMGGSASSGDFLSCLSELDGCLPFISHRGYDLPTWVSENWLVIATSYSGNTEETLDALDAAIELGCDVIGLSSGGKMQVLLESTGKLWIGLPGGQPPRSAFGHIFGTQVALVWRLGILSPPENLGSILERLSDAVEACDFTIDDAEGDVITEIAASLLGKQISVVSTQSLGPVAYRTVCQLNENSGVFARPHIIPEMNHNEIVAWGEKDAVSNQALLLFNWDGAHERNNMRIEWFLEHIEIEPTWGIMCEGDSHLEALLYAVIMMDWLSCGIALLGGKDPTAIGPITGLKDYLSQ